MNAHIKVLGDSWQVPTPIAGSQTRILIYRTTEIGASGATSVFINGQYHTSLMPGAYSQLCYRPGNMEVSARLVKAGSSTKQLMDAITELDVKAGQTHYLKVIEQGDRLALQPVSATLAHQEAQGLRYQLHAISRVALAQACQEAHGTPYSANTAVSGPASLTRDTEL